MRLNRRALLSAAVGAVAFPCVQTTEAQESGWTLQDDGNGPPARWDHVLVADSNGNSLLLFGGRDGNGVAFADLWSFDLASKSWTELQPGPAARFGSAAAVLPDNSGFLFFGGQADEFFADLWQYDFTTGEWSLLDDGSGTAPTPRYGLGGAFDADGRFIISHGFTFEGRFDDTWAFDAAAGWVDISPAPESRPLRRCLHELAAVDTDHLLLYAGCSSGYGPCPQGDLWRFTPATSEWAQITPAESPAPRSNPAMTAGGNSILLVGGLTENGPSADIWSGVLNGDNFAWTRLDAASDIISPRSSHDMTQIDGMHYLFGGLGTDGPLADLWQYTPIA